MSREEDILSAMINDESYDKTPQSRNEEILVSILNGTEYTKTPQSREEELYLQLKEKIEGGGSTKYFINPPVPKEKNYEYTGEPLTFEFDAIDAEHCIVTGGTETEAGTYTVTVYLVENAYWTDTEDNVPKTFIWTIERVFNFGFHINGAESDPSAKVTYLADAVGLTPAHMDFANDRFDYGSWENAFFMPRPCILNQNGTVRCYLDPNDYEKDVDGNAVAIDSTLTGANVMIEFPKIWYKIVPDAGDDTSASIYIANKNIDGEYKDYAYIASDGVTHKEHFYLSAFIAKSIGGGASRSFKGQTISNDDTIADFATVRQLVRANGAGWDCMCYCDQILLTILVVLMSKSINSQSSFGSGMVDASLSILTGETTSAGMFTGKTTNNNPVKVFGIENLWSRFFMKVNGGSVYKNTESLKMCYGLSDGTDTLDYSDVGNGYKLIYTCPGNIGDEKGYISKIKFYSDYWRQSQLSGGDSSGYCDYYASYYNAQDYNGYHYCYGFGGTINNGVAGNSGIFAQSNWSKVYENPTINGIIISYR